MAAAVAAFAAPAGAPAASSPAIGLRPGDADNPVYARKVAEAAPDAAHMELPWEDAQPNPGPPDWRILDNNFGLYIDQGVNIGSVRVVVPPDWAVEGGHCPNEYIMCPPARNHYDDFQSFVRKAADRYGPGTRYDIERWVLWNEPDHYNKWGGETYADRSYEEYSDLLSRFHEGVMDGSPDAHVDAGEVMGGKADPPGEWVERFTRYNTEERRNDSYETLTIHSYSRYASGVVEKIRAHGRLPGVQGVSVTEFGWAVGRSNPKAPPRSDDACVDSEREQRQKFLRTVHEVRERTEGVGRLVWLNAVDRIRDKNIRCIDHTGYYDDRIKESVSPYALYKRAPNGDTRPTVARLIAAAFRRLAAE